jgi:hypothetical protein
VQRNELRYFLCSMQQPWNTFCCEAPSLYRIMISSCKQRILFYAQLFYIIILKLCGTVETPPSSKYSQWLEWRSLGDSASRVGRLKGQGSTKASCCLASTWKSTQPQHLPRALSLTQYSTTIVTIHNNGHLSTQNRRRRAHWSCQCSRQESHDPRISDPRQQALHSLHWRRNIHVCW